ncbi:MAG TPA: von Willebrand factor type A domain-containing protein [Thermoanaerobaculia bacterium]|jgi:Ca-activated chloride channel family protein|nr:von Willebrand factor type A domain-containing protein [Thermoanaerobaculia bacterium]
MSRLNERDIARKLAEREGFEPPAGLLEKIKNEIPPTITVGTEVPGTERRSPMATKQRWLMAASLIAMAGAGLVALQVREQAPSLEESVAPVERQAAPAPVRPPASSAAPVPESAAPEPVMEPQGGVPLVAQEERKEERAAEKDAASSLDEVQDLEEVASPPPPPPPPPAAMAKPAPKVLLESRRDTGGANEVTQPAEIPATVEGGVEGGVVGGVPGGVVGGVVDSVPVGQLSRAGVFDRIQPGQPYPDVKYKSAGVNGFEETAKDRLSTFGLDVDTASYTVARRYLSDSNLPDPRSVRVEEFVNFFDYGDAPPTRGDFAIKAEGGPSPFAQGPRYRLLRFNIRGRVVDPAKRRPAVLTFVIDISGSMDMENRLELVKRSLSLLLDQLKPTDRIGLVVYGSEARVLLEPTNDREAVRQAIDRLHTDGATNAEAGLTLGYDVAARNFRLNASNRILLCSDGVANVGLAGPQAILGRIGREARRGIELSTLGFGMGNYNDHLMEQLADKGDGRYAYIDTIDEAKRVLVEEVTGTLQTIAKDAKVQVEFNPAVVARYRLLGYENRAIADERFRDDKVDAGEVGAGHGVTALYEIELKPGASSDGLVAALHLRYRSPEVGNQTETVRKLYLSELARSWEQASPAFRLAASVGAFAEILRESPWAKGMLSDVTREIRAAAAALPKRNQSAAERVQELVEMVSRAARIKAEGALE